MSWFSTYGVLFGEPSAVKYLKIGDGPKLPTFVILGSKSESSSDEQEYDSDEYVEEEESHEEDS